MKLKSIVFVMSCFLVLGLSANVSAVVDNTGEPTTSGVDIFSSWVEVANQDENPANGYQTASVGVKMNAGSTLPAVLIFDFDVDNDTATGTGSIISGIPTATCGGGICKSDALGEGWDILLQIILRTQTAGSFRNCVGCSGGGVQCTTQGTSQNCNEGTCYELGTSCESGAGCYVVEAPACSGCDGSNPTYPMTLLCDDATGSSCAKNSIVGEWQAGYGQQGKVMNGNFNVPLGYNHAEEDSVCVEIPWNQIVAAVYGAIEVDPFPDQTNFNLATALANPPKFQVTAMKNFKWGSSDPAEAGQDFFRKAYPLEDPGFYLTVTDWYPDAIRAADGQANANAPCEYNQEGVYGDIDVDAADVTGFLEDFGREEYYLPCPGCRAPLF